jgi:glycosyltransferase involved in cell wall biosynthesis
MKAQGGAVALFCPPDGELARRAPAGGIELFACPLRQDYDLRAVRRLAEAVRRFRPDVVHAHHPRAHAIALLASFFVSIPRLVVSRRVSFKLNPWNPFSQWKYRSSRIAAFVAVSEDIKRVLVAGGVPEKRVEVIYSGVDTARFAPRPPVEDLRRTLGLPADVPVVGNLTHYSWWKGQSFFLQAAQKLLSDGVRAHFLLVGKDTDGPDARERVRALGIADHVTLAGFRTDMPEVLSLLSASVVSSLAGEGFSGVLRESMSMGVPVVATDVGGNRELVENGRTGFLVPAGDAPALAEALGRTLTNPDAARARAVEAQRRVRENYSIDSMIRRNMNFYRRLIAGGAR